MCAHAHVSMCASMLHLFTHACAGPVPSSRGHLLHHTLEEDVLLKYWVQARLTPCMPPHPQEHRWCSEPTSRMLNVLKGRTAHTIKDLLPARHVLQVGAPSASAQVLPPRALP